MTTHGRRVVFLAARLSLLALIGGCTCHAEEPHASVPEAPEEGRGAAEKPSSSEDVPNEPSWGGLRVRIVGDEADSSAPVVVLLHGWGAEGDDLLPVARHVSGRAPTRVVLPEAPLEGARGGRAWWHLDLEKRRRQLAAGTRDLSDDVPEGLPEARARILALLETVQRRLGAPPDRTVIAGFSQGAMLAMDVALHSDEDLAAAAVMSGTLLAEREWREQLAEKRGMPVFISHGRRDEVLPFEMSVMLRDMLQDAGLKVTWLPFDGGHAFPPTVIRELGAFLKKTL